MRKLSSEYIELGCAYERMDSSQIQQIFISNTDLFQKQHTYYLVKKVVSTLSKQLIIRLTNSFVTMKIHDVAERVGLRNEQHAHALLFEMIKHDMISANIDDRRGIVSLMDNDIICEKKISSNISKSHMNHCLCIVQRIEDFRENLGVDPEYVCKEMTILQSRRSTSNLSALGMVAGHDARAMASLDAEFLT